MSRRPLHQKDTPNGQHAMTDGPDTIDEKRVGIKEVIPAVVDYYYILGLVLGGCCAYVLIFQFRLFSN
jgi:hypothetical protein